MGTAVDSGQSLLLQQDGTGGVYSTLPITLTKGRPPKEALQNQRTIRFEVRSLEEFESTLREHLDSNPEHPENILARFSFWTGASFLVTAPQEITLRQQQQQLANAPLPTPPLEGQQGQSQHQHHNAPPGYQPAMAPGVPQYGNAHLNPPNSYHSSAAPTAPPAPNSSNPPQQRSNEKVTMTIDSVLTPTLSRDDRLTKNRQLVFAKALIAAVQRADGFRYSFHNSWYSGRDHRAFGFSYYCNDSFLNKDRAANGKGTKLGKRATKPVFPCGGLVRMLFSAVEKTLVLEYRHNPCHKTYAERAPPPRPNAKRRRVDGEGEAEAAVDGNGLGVMARPPRPKKRKEKAPLISVESELLAQSRLSMLDLIRTDPLPGMAPASSADGGLNGQGNGGGNVNGAVAAQAQGQPKPPKRSRRSCEMCHAKRAKCDAVRPTCSTCRDKGRQCIYSADEDGQPAAEQEQAQDPEALVAELRKKLADMEEKYAEAQAQIREFQAKEKEREREREVKASTRAQPVGSGMAIQTQSHIQVQQQQPQQQQQQHQVRTQPQTHMQPPRRQSHGRQPSHAHVHYQAPTRSPLQAQPPSLQDQLQSHLQDQSQPHLQNPAQSYTQVSPTYPPPSQTQSQYQAQQPQTHYQVQQGHGHALPAASYRQAQAQQGQASPWVFYQ
ncbi:uncharacterized protein EI97DRAFT_433946 [Westerdykella ornata]|uniref:Zn(2)-C6 fungal-type domain-containing protein n=1 Tax=Westerdykella ornata TaxID=318751 RepID=A0A6A6JJZ2_WESOR|nr:uncharacterized protein EI97DRAFT_433946 [Westerdykella ornata]KAF2276016.1 hypothetical protein EI97DRAFT_433946 [Westerdykella ornata]